jgi:hypothetical protein
LHSPLERHPARTAEGRFHLPLFTRQVASLIPLISASLLLAISDLRRVSPAMPALLRRTSAGRSSLLDRLRQGLDYGSFPPDRRRAAPARLEL